MTNHASPETRIAALVQAALAERAITRTLALNDGLIDAGLSSLDLVKLVLKVEAEFNLELPAGDISPANFRSPATILALVTRLLGNGA